MSASACTRCMPGCYSSVDPCAVACKCQVFKQLNFNFACRQSRQMNKLIKCMKRKNLIIKIRVLRCMFSLIFIYTQRFGEAVGSSTSCLLVLLMVSRACFFHRITDDDSYDDKQPLGSHRNMNGSESNKHRPTSMTLTYNRNDFAKLNANYSLGL